MNLSLYQDMRKRSTYLIICFVMLLAIFGCQNESNSSVFNKKDTRREDNVVTKVIPPQDLKSVAEREKGKNIFQQKLHKIDFQVNKKDVWDKLMLNYVQAAANTDREQGVFAKQTYEKMGVKINGQLYSDIGMRAKGKYSFQSCVSDKKPFKLYLNNNVDTLYWDGLEKLDLRNAIADPTFIRLPLAYYFFNKYSIPAPRTTLAQVSFLDEYMGIYVLVENIGTNFLDGYFGNRDGLLYKIEEKGIFRNLGEEPSNYKGTFSPKSGTKIIEPRLIEFVKIASSLGFNGIDKNSLEVVFNVEAFLKGLALAEVMAIGDVMNGRNHYLYWNPSNHKWEWIWWVTNHALMNSVKPLYLKDVGLSHRLLRGILKDPEYRKTYIQWLRYFRQKVLIEEMPPLVKEWKELVARLVEKESDQSFFSDWEDYIKDKTYIEEAPNAQPLKKLVDKHWSQLKWSEEKLDQLKKANLSLDEIKRQTLQTLDGVVWNDRTIEGLELFLKKRKDYVNDMIRELENN